MSFRNFLAGCLTAFIVIHPSPANATNVEVLPQKDAYLITGGAIHHSNFTKDREEAATCENCFWKVVTICKSWLDTSHGSCPWLRLQCPVDMQLVEVFRANALARPAYASAEWYFVSYSCIGDAGPISSEDIANSLSQSWLVKVPQLQIRFSPPNDAILWHPLKFEILSNSSFVQTQTLLGTKVTLHASSFLDFQCNAIANITSCLSVNSQKLKFKKVGIFQITATAKWDATYDALGIEGISVSGNKPTSTIKNTFNVHPLFTHLIKY